MGQIFCGKYVNKNNQFKAIKFRNNGNLQNGKGKTPLVVINSENETTTTTVTSVSPPPSYQESKNAASPFGPIKAPSTFSLKSAINKFTHGKAFYSEYGGKSTEE